MSRAREAGIDKNARGGTRNQGAVATASAREHRYDTHIGVAYSERLWKRQGFWGRYLWRNGARLFHIVREVRGLGRTDAPLFRLQQRVRLVSNKQRALRFRVHFESSQVASRGSRARFRLNLAERETGPQFIEAIAELVGGGKHRFELLPRLDRLA